MPEFHEVRPRIVGRGRGRDQRNDIRRGSRPSPTALRMPMRQRPTTIAVGRAMRTERAD